MPGGIVALAVLGHVSSKHTHRYYHIRECLVDPCDDAFFTIQEGKCIDVSVPGAIPNWLGAPVVKLLPPTPKLLPAPTCQSKGHVERLYHNTCRCARGSTALDVSTATGLPRGNCTGMAFHLSLLFI